MIFRGEVFPFIRKGFDLSPGRLRRSGALMRKGFSEVFSLPLDLVFRSVYVTLWRRGGTSWNKGFWPIGFFPCGLLVVEGVDACWFGYQAVRRMWQTVF